MVSALSRLLPTEMPEQGFPPAVSCPVFPCSTGLNSAAAHPLTQRHVVPAGAWAKVLRSCRADRAALAIPFNMRMPAGFQYQMPVLDARNPDAITFVVESDPPQLSLGCSIPRKLELQLMAVDLWQQAVWAQKQHHNQADHNAHIASALKKVQAVVRLMQKQQAAAGEQVGRAGSADTWPAVVLPSPNKRGGGSRINIQGPSQGAQVAHVQHGREPLRGPELGLSGAHVQPLQRREASLQPSAAPAAPAPAQQQLQQQQTAKPLQAATMAVAEAAQQAAEAGPGPAQQPTQAAVEVLPDAVATMAAAEAAQQAAEAGPVPAQQPTQAADDASQQQPSQAAAVVLPDAAIQAAVEAKVQAAMAQQMVQVGSNLKAMQCALQQEVRLTAESASCQMSDLQRELQQATQAHQELRSQVACQEEAIQQLQQAVDGQVSRRDEGPCAGNVVTTSPPGSLAEAASVMPAQGWYGACSPLDAYSVTRGCIRAGLWLQCLSKLAQNWQSPSNSRLQTTTTYISPSRCLIVCCYIRNRQPSLHGTLQALELSGQQDEFGYDCRGLQSLEGELDAVNRDVRQLQQEGSVDIAEGDEQEVRIDDVSQHLGELQQGAVRVVPKSTSTFKTVVDRS